MVDAAPAPIVVLDVNKNVVLWNRAAEHLYGWSAAEVLGKPNPAIPVELADETDNWRRDALEGRRRIFKTRRVRRDGSSINIVLGVAGLRDQTGVIRYTVGIIHDLDELHESELRARRAEERSRALLASVTDLAILFVNADGRVVEVNRGAELLLGRNASEMTDVAIRTLLDLDEDALRVAETTRQFTAEMLCTRPGGTQFWSEAVLTPLANTSESATEYVLLLRDVSRRKSDHERERRRMQQTAAVAAFAQRATFETTPEAVAEAAVEHVAAAMQADYTEVLTPANEGKALITAYAFGWGAEPAPTGKVDPAAPTIYAEAIAQRDPVVRELTESDYEHAPHLRELGVQWGAVLAAHIGENVCTMGVFSHEPIHEFYVHPLQSIAAMCEAVTARRYAERQLAERDRTFTMILDQMPAIVWTVDLNHHFTMARGGGLRPLDASSEGFLGKPVYEFAPEGHPVHRALELALAGEPSSYIGSFHARTYDNRVEPLRGPAGNIVGVLNVAFDITDRRRDEEALRVSHQELRRLSARLNHLQEEERRRIAHELHDELGQRLTALRMETALLPYKLGERNTPAAAEAIESMIALIDETIVTVRRVATELRPAILDDFGFRAALELELAALQKRSGIEYSILFEPDDLTVGRDHATTLYRIVQESLTNVARHSGATFVSVAVRLRDESIRVEIADNGRGITADRLASESSLGLLGIRERAYAHGGEADVRAGPAGGTVVSVRLPAGGPR